MSGNKLAVNSPLFRRIFVGLYLCLYLVIGLYTELQLTALKHVPDTLLEDFRFYERAVIDALRGNDPYAIRSIGEAFLYPPPAMLIVEILSYIQPFVLKVAVYSTINLALLALIVYGISSHYGYSIGKVWYWYVLCFAFAPFLELLHIGQINMITLFGIFMLFIWEETWPILGGIGLGFAAVTKVTPLLFLGYLLVNKRFKTITVSVAVIALLTCLSVLRYGPSPVLEYPDVFHGLVNQFPLGANSQSLVAKLAPVAKVDLLQQAMSALPKAWASPINSVFAFFATQFRVVQTILTIYSLLAIATSGWFTLYGKQPREPMFIVTALAMMLSPNVMWYHHYVFGLLPILIWMAWSRLDKTAVGWCLAGLLIVQFDRRVPPYGLLIHIFGQISLLAILVWQAQQYYSRRKVHPVQVLG